MDTHVAERVAHAGNLLAEFFQLIFQRFAIAVQLPLRGRQFVLEALPLGRCLGAFIGQGLAHPLPFRLRFAANDLQLFLKRCKAIVIFSLVAGFLVQLGFQGTKLLVERTLLLLRRLFFEPRLIERFVEPADLLLGKLRRVLLRRLYLRMLSGQGVLFLAELGQLLACLFHLLAQAGALVFKLALLRRGCLRMLGGQCVFLLAEVSQFPVSFFHLLSQRVAFLLELALRRFGLLLPVLAFGGGAALLFLQALQSLFASNGRLVAGLVKLLLQGVQLELVLALTVLLFGGFCLDCVNLGGKLLDALGGGAFLQPGL